mgnify:CR=1 FL=1
MENTSFKKLMKFNGDHGELVGLRIINNLLTAITLGIYYPWARAAYLQYIYGETEYMGTRFVFHGTGKEMFIGFIKAIGIIVGLYIFMLICFFSQVAVIAILGVIVFYIAILVIIPIAIHGSNKYRLSRTSWRGIHFGYRGILGEFLKMYLVEILLTAVTFGIYSSWMHVKVNKYIKSHIRFGNIELAKTKWLVKGVVKGIGDYGNAFGIPTVGGEVYFDDCYETNILVNAMSVGIAKVGTTISAISEGVGNPVYIFGAATGKDGIHGAAFASKDISEDSVNDLPSVQVGDPFWEKLILEASMELIETGSIIGMQDMGAAGITCSTSEMAAKSKTGMKVHLDKVPMRQENMKGWEILLSESQERMLVILKKGTEKEAEAIFKKWELTYAQIGEVTEGDRVQYYMNGKLEADIPAESLVLGGGAPIYKREWTEPTYFEKIKAYKFDAIEEPSDLKAVAEFLLCEPNIASKNWVFTQYDSMVGTVNQSTNKASDAAVVRVKGSNKSLALTVDCNSRYVYADPETGCAIAVAEAARNIVCTGGVPGAVTNCLNFGNPYDKEVYYQFKHSIDGMGKACLKFGTPVTGGNVSFYNQSTEGVAVFPTPTIGMVGIIEKPEHHMGSAFQAEGDLIFLIGKSQNDISSSQYLAKYHKVNKFNVIS